MLYSSTITAFELVCQHVQGPPVLGLGTDDLELVLQPSHIRFCFKDFSWLVFLILFFKTERLFFF